MVYEAGGRADKRGNVYENRYLAHLLLKLVSEEMSAVVVEPAGENANAYEYYTISPDNKKTYYQCKGSNGALDYWRPSDLKGYNVFTRSKKLLLEDPSCKYKFVSPFYYDELDELCNRARTCDSPQELLDLLSNEKLKNAFSACERYYNLHRDNPKELQQLKNILSRCEFLVLPDNSDSVENLTRLVGFYFTGSADETRVFLENYANDIKAYGVKITANTILSAFEAEGIYSRNIRFDSRIAPEIERINKSFDAAYTAINGSIFHRDCTEEILQSIESGKSVIVHGKAGLGKSGCIHELAEYFKSKKIPYLALRLDKYTPSGYADKYGQELGLKESPVFCLNNYAAGEKCVLLLDQLDSLRWTAANSSTALDVCKEMIAQAEDINKHRGGHISLVFCSRTFDLENDNRIKELFCNETKFLPWAKTNVGELSNEEVRSIVGSDYNNLSKRVKKLLQTPSSLYVWLMLPQNKRNTVSSPQQMIISWWNEILDNSAGYIQSKNDLTSCVENIVSAMSQKSCFALPTVLFQNNMKEIEYLASSGLIVKTDDKIAFAHQSILDVFLIQKDLMLIYGKESLLQVIFDWRNQTPSMRYRFSVLLQTLIDTDLTSFVDGAIPVLNSPLIHFYFKCAIFEIIGQYQTPDDSIFKLIDDFNSIEDWHGVIKNAVFANHIVYLRHLAEDKAYDWMSDEGISLLRTVRSSAPSFVADILRRSLSSSKENMERVFSVLSNCIEEEAEELFQLRVEIYEKNIEQLRVLYYINIKETPPAHVIAILKLFLRHSELYDITNLYLPDDEIENFIHKNFSFILAELFEVVCEQANSIPLSLHSLGSLHNKEWYPSQYRQSIVRDIVELIKKSMVELATVSPKEVLRYVLLSEKNKNAVSNEIVLSALLALPTSYSDYVISWLISDFEKNIVDCVSNEKDYLNSCKIVLEKHSPFCSEENFRRLEEKICNWRDDREKMIEQYKYRVEHNRERKGEPIYCAFWGALQKDLLPMLDKNRISSKTKGLISVLDRNDWVIRKGYHAGIIMDSAHHVVSTIHDRAENLSDKTWLAISSANIDREHSVFRRNSRYPYYYETSHSMFASDMGRCAEKDPKRFAMLSLMFPENIDSSYVINVTNVLANGTSTPVDFNIVCRIVLRYMGSPDENVVKNLLRIIKNRANEEWPDDVIMYVKETATGSMRPVGNEYGFSRDDKENMSPEALNIASINFPRSEAVYTIAHLLNAHPAYIENFRPVLKKLSEDESDAVRFALVKCAALVYQYDSEFATTLFDTLLKRDLCIISASKAFWLMNRNIEKYCPFLMEACKSPSQELAKEAAHLLCIIAIRTANQTALKFLCSKDWPNNIIDEICSVAIEAFENVTLRQIGQQILEYFIFNSDDNSLRLDGLFWNNCLDLHRDKDLILLVLKKQSNSDIIYSFVRFLKNQNVSEITEFAEVVYGLIQNTVKSYRLREIENDLVSIVISLIDRAGNDKKAMSICLDILDSIYKKEIFTNNAIESLIHGAE